MSSNTLLQVATAVAKDVGLSVPTIVAAATDASDRAMVEMKQVLDFTGEEIARRVDWSFLRTTTVIAGTGVASAFALPAACQRLIAGAAVTVGGIPLRGGLSGEEFLSLAAVAGTTRFYLTGGTPGTMTIQFWPTLANATNATVYYQSANWNGTASAATYVADSDIALIPDQLMIKGGIARWRRQKGMDYQDYASEFEMALQNYAMFDDNARSP